MTTRRDGGTLVSLVVAVLLLLLPTSVRADEPVMTDPSGDGGPLGLVCIFTSVSNCFGGVASEPGIDIVHGDFATSGNALEASLGVVDLDDLTLAANESAHYFFTAAITGNVRMMFSFDRLPGATSATGRLTVTKWSTFTNASTEVPVTLDNASNTVNWSVTLRTLDRLRADVCPDCAPIRRSTVLGDIRAEAQHRRNSNTGWTLIGIDLASTTNTYTIGDR